MIDSNDNPIEGFIIYADYESAEARADTEGESVNMPYFNGTGSSRFVSAPEELEDGTWALDITNYSFLTEDEINAVVPTVTFKTYA